MPGLQALERIAKTIPMQPGQPERIEYEYKRHGTSCLIGNWDVVLGHMIARTIRETRTEEDFAWHIYRQTVLVTPPSSGLRPPSPPYTREKGHHGGVVGHRLCLSSFLSAW